MPCFIPNTRLFQPGILPPPPDHILDPDWQLSDSEDDELLSDEIDGGSQEELIKVGAGSRRDAGLGPGVFGVSRSCRCGVITSDPSETWSGAHWGNRAFFQ